MAARPLQCEGLREHRGRVSEALGEDLRDGAAGRFFEVLDIAYHK